MKWVFLWKVSLLTCWDAAIVSSLAKIKPPLLPGNTYHHLSTYPPTYPIYIPLTNTPFQHAPSTTTDSDDHKDALAKRILQIRAEAEATDNKFDKEKSIERVAALGGGRSLIDDHPPSTVESLH